MTKTLVVSLGQLRGSSVTLANFQLNLLDPLDADYAVCTTNDSHFSKDNPFFRLAKYHWIARHFDDLGLAYDAIAKVENFGADWRKFITVGGNWLGGIKSFGQPGMGALLFYLRWAMLKSIIDNKLNEVYDTVVITRTDFMFLCPHPQISVLGRDFIHIPNGEDYGGLNDRHMVVPMSLFADSVNLLTSFLYDPIFVIDRFRTYAENNIECYLASHFQNKGLTNKVRRFPYIMYLARSKEDPTSWSTGKPIQDLDHQVKYQQEYQQAKFFAEIIKDQEDWGFYFDAIGSKKWNPESWLGMFTHLSNSELDNTRRSIALFAVGLLVDAYRHRPSRGIDVSNATTETLYSMLQTYNRISEKRYFGQMSEFI